MRTFITVFILALTCNAASANDGLIRAAFGYVTDSTTSGGTTTTNTRQDIDVAAGYMWANRVNLFAAYGSETDTNGSSTMTRTSYGAGLGWISKNEVGPYISGTYYIQSTYNPGAMTGTGYQADVGLKIDFSKITLLIGFAYAKFSYTKNASGPISPAYSDSHIDPRLGFLIEF